MCGVALKADAGKSSAFFSVIDNKPDMYYNIGIVKMNGGAVIKKKRKIFATARGYGEFQGQWEFPGGKIEEGETFQQALEREIKE